MTIGRGKNDTMFFSAPFNLNNFIKNCKKMYGVSPRPHWVTTYYGGQVHTSFSYLINLLVIIIMVISYFFFNFPFDI